MSIYQGILTSDNNNIKTKFLKQLVTEQTTLKNEDEYNKRLKFLYRACIGEIHDNYYYNYYYNYNYNDNYNYKYIIITIDILNR